MTHILPPHTDLNLVPSSLHSALHMDPNQQQQQQLQQANQPHQQQAPTTSKKRGRKADANSDDAGSPSEPRRLRRSHEACARCRSKKIKASPVGRHRPQISVRLSSFFSDTTMESYSVTRNILNARHARLLESLANRRTDTGRLSLSEVTQNISSARLLNAMLF
jgi:hypothetical protein